VQAAIYGVALSLDSFVLNGLPYGVLLRDAPPGFLEKTARNLLRDLATLEEQALHVDGASQPQAVATMARLRQRCQQLIDVVSGLRSFAKLPLAQVQSDVAELRSLHGDCVRLIQELEVCVGVLQPFYQSRQADSAAAVEHFLAGLEQLFIQARSAGEGA
jgi:hypothetical protein